MYDIKVNVAQQIERVSFKGANVMLWAIVGIDTAVFGFGGFGVPIPTLVTGNGQYWIETDSDGVDQLCTTKRIGAPVMTGHFLDPINPVSIQATPFEFILDSLRSEIEYMPKAQD